MHISYTGGIQQSIYRVKGQGLCHANCASYEEMITSWVERLQFRVPGVTVVLIATHIDCAPSEQVDLQCATVKEVAQRILSRQRLQESENDVSQIRIYDNGTSLKVNNMSGEGIIELRLKLQEIAESMSFYGEILPSSYVKLKAKLRSMQKRSDMANWKTRMTWDEYEKMAAECNINPGN